MRLVHWWVLQWALHKYRAPASVLPLVRPSVLVWVQR
jgi:hypothetical protein